MGKTERKYDALSFHTEETWSGTIKTMHVSES